jgi:hypothetical protein
VSTHQTPCFVDSGRPPSAHLIAFKLYAARN